MSRQQTAAARAVPMSIALTMGRALASGFQSGASGMEMSHFSHGKPL